MGDDRRRRPRRRPARLDRRDAAARQAQADLHAPCRLRRQCHRHQCRQGGADRPQGASRKSTTSTPAISAASRSAPRSRSSPAASPSASSRRPSSACCRAARSAASSSAICGSIRRRASARGAAAGNARRRRHEPQEQEDRVNGRDHPVARRAVDAQAGGRAAGAEICAEARQAGPRLCHRQAQERRRPRVDQARRRQDHRQRPPGRDLFRPSGAAHDDPAAAGRRRAARASSTSSARCPAAAFPARPARCVTACRRR